MVDHEHATKWAVECLSKMLCHPSINLTMDEANHAAQCMTLLSGRMYFVRSRQGQAQRSWYVSVVDAPNTDTNKHRSGT